MSVLSFRKGGFLLQSAAKPFSLKPYTAFTYKDAGEVLYEGDLRSKYIYNVYIMNGLPIYLPKL